MYYSKSSLSEQIIVGENHRRWKSSSTKTECTNRNIFFFPL